MSRRRLVAIVSASVMLFLGFMVVAAVLSITQTEFGRERVRRLINSSLASAMRGRASIYVGRISGSLLTGVVIDSVAIRDEEDSLFIATGEVRARYDPRDIVDKRLLLSYLEVSRPVVNLRRHANREWNFKRIFRSGKKGPKSAERSFGDFVVIDSAVIHGGTVIVTEPWAPPDSLVGARRDSAVRVALTSAAHEIRRTKEGLKKTLRWTELELRSPRVRIADPDSAGRLIVVGTLDVNEMDPPFRFRNLSGPVRILGDSVWLDVHHFDLPASTGRASGKVVLASPTRYDIHVIGDSVSLNDVSWVYPTLPRTGGGSMELTIKNNPRNPSVIEYALRKMDVRSTKSRLVGAMTFGVGGPVLVVKDVALNTDPVDFDLIRTLNGKPFPVDWQGQFTGYVRGKGGPLNRWEVDDAQLAFRDKHVPGAVSEVSMKGGLDILSPGNTIFRGLDLDIRTLDLRTIEYLFRNFPRLRGTIAGTATLDSLWLDVRFKNADITHRDGPGIPSHFTGSGRVTNGEQFVTWDVDLQADPISFTSLARSYPKLQLRGPYAGPLRVRGTVADLDLATTLTGAAGTMAVDGHFDFDPPGFAARATGSARGLDVRTLLDRPTLPATQISGRFAGDLRGDSLVNLAGKAAVDLDSSRVSTVRLNPSTAWLSFGGGRLRVDTLRLNTDVARVVANGALGLAPGVSDTLRYSIFVDSLGGLRPYLRKPPRERKATALAAADTALAADGRGPRSPARADSLLGRGRSEGVLIGSIDTLAARGTVSGSGLFVNGSVAERLGGSYSFTGLPSAARGAAMVKLDSVAVSGIRLDSTSAALSLNDRSTGRLTASAFSSAESGSFQGVASLAFRRTADSLRLLMDTLAVRLRGRDWTLTAPTSIVFDTVGTSIDSVVLRNGLGGVVAVRGTFPNSRPVDGSFVLDNFPLADFSVLAQTRKPLGGFATLDLRVTGVRQSPVLRLAARFRDMLYGELRLPYFTMQGSYAERQLELAAEVFRNSRPVLSLTGAVPMDVALTPMQARVLGDTLRGRVRADSVDLALLQAMSPQFTRVTGTASTDIDIAGTWGHPHLSGRFRIHNGEMGLPRLGIRLRRMNADVRLTPDTIHVADLSMTSGTQPNSSLSLSGIVGVSNYAEYKSTYFDLTMRARNFQAVDRKTLARLEISSSLHLRGPFQRAVLTGNMTVERGTLYLPELAQKQVVNLNDPEFYDVVDTSMVGSRSLLPKLAPDVETAIRNLQIPTLEVRIGDDVWLRSAEANIKLAGAVDIARRGNQQLQSGTLSVERGTYRLNLGLVQRTFQVDSGSVTFYGDPNIPASLDIYASYTVRQANRQDVHIIAHIGGTLLEPRLALSSEERIPLSDTEILSYLVFGQPSFAVDVQTANALRPVAAALLPTLGGVLERALADQIGFFDFVQVQTGSVGEQDALTNVGAYQSVLSGSRIGVGKQIGERTFITANAGLCRLSPSAQTNTSFTSSLGLSVEHRLNRGFSIQASSEPSSAALLCRPGFSEIGSRPRQYGFDLFREWSF